MAIQKKLRVLIACEFSGIEREAFRARGHDAWSCDLIDTEQPSPYHIKDDVLNHLDDGWDIIVGHPPCTDLAVSGAKWFERKGIERQQRGVDFFMALWNAPVERIALENPISVISTFFRPPDQIIQPWEFGEEEQKTTCLWLKRLPFLRPTKIVKPRLVTLKNGDKMSARHYETFFLPKEQRGHERSRAFKGIAEAMADQWPTEQILLGQRTRRLVDVYNLRLSNN